MNDAQQADATDPAVPVKEPVRLSWSQPHGMVGLSIKNFLLRIATLGIYGFWGKTEVRRRIWTGIRLNGEPMQYTGTGKELLIGFLIVVGVVMLPTTLLSLAATIAFGPNSPWLALYQVVLTIAFFYLLGVAIHRAQRYRLSRTTWRGIRGGLDGNSWTYAWQHFWTALLLIPTLGWAKPWRDTKLQRAIVNDMRFGDRHFKFDAPSGPLFARFAVVWFGMLALVVCIGIATMMAFPFPVPGRKPEQIDQNRILMFVGAIYGLVFLGFLVYALLSAWYRAGVMNHFASHTTFEGLRLEASASGAGLVWLALSNFLIVVAGGMLAAIVLSVIVGGIGAAMATAAGIDLTNASEIPRWLLAALPVAGLIILAASMSLLVPLAQMRSARYFIEHIALQGELPLAQIAQGAADASKRGEGLAQVFDVDAF